MKFNNNKALRENLKASAYVFLLRDKKGDLMNAKGVNTEDTINKKLEEIIILNAAKYCKQANYNSVIIKKYSLLLENVLRGEGIVNVS